MNSIFIISFIFSTLLIFIFSKILNKVSFGQSIRKLGPKKHFVKEGTPNIGGVFIIIITTIITLIFGISLKEYKITFMLIMPIISYGVLGFLDDYLKLKRKTENEILSFDMVQEAFQVPRKRFYKKKALLTNRVA